MKIIDIPNCAQADPFVISSGGKFYMYCTAVDGVHCYESSSLFGGWTFVGTVLSVAGQKEYWAPAVIETGGMFYMYYSSMPTDGDDVHMQCIKVAVSTRAVGPFVYKCDLLAPFSIDPHPVMNESGLYMFYSVNGYSGDRVGTYIVCDKMRDFYTVCGKPKPVVVPTRDEEIFERDRFRAGEHWHTIEGACYFRVGDRHYCTYSGNCYQKPTYHIGYAVCRSKSSALDELDFEKVGASGEFAPLVAENEFETSTGHNSVIEVDGQLYMVYHGRDKTVGAERTARICKLYAENGRLIAERI